jgi:hypothetical protein
VKILIVDDEPSITEFEVMSCIDVLLPKPISVETFNALLDDALQLAETMEGIRLLGESALVLR